MDWLTVLASSMGFSITLAGAMGGVARWIFIVLVDRKMAFRQGVATVVLGAILGYYVSPYCEGIMAPWFAGFEPDPARLPAFVAFGTGVGGIGVVGFFIDWWAGRRKQLSGEGGIESPAPAIEKEPKP